MYLSLPTSAFYFLLQQCTKIFKKIFLRLWELPGLRPASPCLQYTTGVLLCVLLHKLYIDCVIICFYFFQRSLYYLSNIYKQLRLLVTMHNEFSADLASHPGCALRSDSTCILTAHSYLWFCNMTYSVRRLFPVRNQARELNLYYCTRET